MATVDSVSKITTSGVLASGYLANLRVIDKIIDFDAEASLAAGDDLAVATLPKGTVVVVAGLEQITGDATSSTLVARVGTVTYSATLAGNAAAGTVTAAAAVDTDILTADTDVNVLAATAARTGGKVRVFVVVAEALKPQIATTADRDVLA